MIKPWKEAESRSLYDEASRRQKAAKIAQVLKEHLGQDLSRLEVLDVGCGSGIITSYLAGHFARTLGIDVDIDGLRFAKEYGVGASTLHFASAGAGRLPCARHRFDVVLCAQVYEHVVDQRTLAREVWRVLKPGGICFFSGPNRLAITEEHYWLPFLSWLPRPLANLYMRLFRRGRGYDVYARTYWSIRRLWRRFDIHDYTVKMIRSPQKYGVGDRVSSAGFARRLPSWLLNALAPFFPNYNWVLEKPRDAA